MLWGERGQDSSGYVLSCTYIFKHFCGSIDYDLRSHFWKTSECGNMDYYFSKICH